jgi:hypothetical protein
MPGFTLEVMMLKFVRRFQISLREALILLTFCCVSVAMLLAETEIAKELLRFGLLIAYLAMLSVAFANPQKRMPLFSFMLGTALFWIYAYWHFYDGVFGDLLERLWTDVLWHRSLGGDIHPFKETTIELVAVYVGLICGWITRSLRDGAVKP